MGGCSGFPILFWVGKHVCIVTKPTNSPQPKKANTTLFKKKIRFKKWHLGRFFFRPPQQYFSVCRDWFLYRKQAARKPSPIKFSADALIRFKSDQQAACPTCTKSHIYVLYLYVLILILATADESVVWLQQ